MRASGCDVRDVHWDHPQHAQHHRRAGHLHRDVEFHAVALDHTAALLSVVNFSGREMHIRNRGLQQRHPRGRRLYTYSIGCTSSGHMTLNWYWYELTCVSPSYQYSPCSCSPGGPQAYSSSGSVSVTCGSISWPGTLTKVSGNLSDPWAAARASRNERRVASQTPGMAMLR